MTIISKQILRKAGNKFRNQIAFFTKFIRKDLRFIFCINSGRSGSQYLAKLLGTAKLVTSYHEAEPYMIGSYLKMITSQYYEETFDKRRVKSKSILAQLLFTPHNTIYAETNHMFIKTFFDVAIHDFTNISVIHLRRRLLDTLKSFVEQGYFTEKGENWPLWMSSPNAKTAAISCIAPDNELDNIDLIIAYLIDIEARAQRFKKDFPIIKTIEAKLEDLNNSHHVQNLFHQLNIIYTQETNDILGEKINQRTEWKNKLKIKIDTEYLKSRIENYIQRAKTAGIKIPRTLYI